MDRALGEPTHGGWVGEWALLTVRLALAEPAEVRRPPTPSILILVRTHKYVKLFSYNYVHDAIRSPGAVDLCRLGNVEAVNNDYSTATSAGAAAVPGPELAVRRHRPPFDLLTRTVRRRSPEVVRAGCSERAARPATAARPSPGGAAPRDRLSDGMAGSRVLSSAGADAPITPAEVESRR